MEIRTYDQVDPSHVLGLNMLALGFPLTPGLANTLRRYDRRYVPFLTFHAVVSDQVAGQVGLLTTTVETMEGPALFGAVWAVCTLPQFGRQGIARTLMQRAEQAALALGCQAITLGTTRTRVAYRLYRSMEYEDLLPISQAFDFGPPRKPDSQEVEVRRVRDSELPALEQVFLSNTEGMLGFVRRHEGFLHVAMQTVLSPGEVHGVFRQGRLVGYVLASQGDEFLRVRCPVLPRDLSLHQVVDQLRALYSSPYVAIGDLLRHEHIQALRQAGYVVQESWGTVMLKPLGARRDVRRLLGLEEGRFYMDSLDIT